MADIKDDDPNMIDARQAVVGKTTLIIMGSSILKSTNGRALHFLDACDVKRVVFVNPDTTRVHDQVKDDLRGWGLAGEFHLECMTMAAGDFAEAVLRSAGMETLHQRCMRWIQPAKVNSMRRRFPLPPVADLGAVATHKFGAGRVTVGLVFGRVETLNSQAAHAMDVTANGTKQEDEDGTPQAASRGTKRHHDEECTDGEGCAQAEDTLSSIGIMGRFSHRQAGV
jgi:hypothetical protein